MSPMTLSDFQPGPFGVLARWSVGDTPRASGVALVGRNFHDAADRASRTLARFIGGDGYRASLPREPGELQRSEDAVSVTLQNGRIEISLVRFRAQPAGPVPLQAPQAVTVRNGQRIVLTLLVNGTRDAWQAAQEVQRRVGNALTVEPYALEDRRPTGGLYLPAEHKIIQAGQAAERLWRQHDAVDFDVEVAQASAALGLHVVGQ